MASRVASRAAGFHLRDVKVTSLLALQHAYRIVATADDPSGAVKALTDNAGITQLLGNSPTAFEGTYLEIDDSSGKPMFIRSTAPRDGGGSAWVSPELNGGAHVGDMLRLPSGQG